MENGIMLQYFSWNMDNDGTLWTELKNEAGHLAQWGITHVWMPPAAKCTQQDSVGYDPYDLYDLGAFDQKGTVRTRYGTKSEYLEAIEALNNAGIVPLADIVLNHKAGADEAELFSAIKVNGDDRSKTIGEPKDIEGFTKFVFKNREGTHSKFTWNFNHFTAVDYNNMDGDRSIFKILGDHKDFSSDVDSTKGNADYLMYSNVHHNHPEVVEELNTWVDWFIETTGVRGFRMDAVKHIDFGFMVDFLQRVHGKQTDFFSVGEYLSGDVNLLKTYLDRFDMKLHLFDFPLHFSLREISHNQTLDISKIFDGSLVQSVPISAVTFVDNHDTENEDSEVADWFKGIAYGLILLWEHGMPCVFHKDLKTDGLGDFIVTLMAIRRSLSYGEQHTYFDHGQVIGWTRQGDDAHDRSGVAVLISLGDAGYKDMYIGKNHAGKTFVDATNGHSEEVTVDDSGHGRFFVNGRNISVWIQKDAVNAL